MIKVRISKANQNAIIPKYAHEGDAGVDLCSTEECIVHPGHRKLIPTGLKMAIPEGYEGQVRPRSGLALKNGISICNTPGTIDAGYRGEIGIILINLGQEDFKVERGMRIAQMIFNKIEKCEFIETDELDKTDRAEGGFGHSGTK